MMQSTHTKILTVPANGQISIGKAWAGRQIMVEEIGNDRIQISSGVFVPDSQRTFHTTEANESLAGFTEWEEANPPKKTDVGALFSSLKKKKGSRAK